MELTLCFLVMTFEKLYKQFELRSCPSIYINLKCLTHWWYSNDFIKMLIAKKISDDELAKNNSES